MECLSSADRVSGDISTDTGPILDRHSANIRSTLGRYVDRVSTATRPTYRPIVPTECRPIVSTDTTYSKHDPIVKFMRDFPVWKKGHRNVRNKHYSLASL